MKKVILLFSILLLCSCSKERSVVGNTYFWEEASLPYVSWETYAITTSDVCIHSKGKITPEYNISTKDTLTYVLQDNTIIFFKNGVYYKEGELQEDILIVGKYLYQTTLTFPDYVQ